MNDLMSLSSASDKDDSPFQSLSDSEVQLDGLKYGANGKKQASLP
jgi:hypothetical protein